MSFSKRRSFSPFNLAFLDIMFCGFGAVVLLVLIINSNTVSTINDTHDDLRGEVNRLELEMVAKKNYHAKLTNSLLQTDKQIISTQGKSNKVLAEIKKLKNEVSRLKNLSLADTQHINKLQADLKNLDKEHQRLGAEIQAEQDQGKNIISFVGQDNRQYLTGLKMGGKRVMILVDTSASMLAESIVNIIRYRNLSNTQKIASKKWQHAVKTAHWLIANLPIQSSFQVYTFNTISSPALTNTAGQWVQASETEKVQKIITSLKQTVPQNGTSLVKAFKTISLFTQQPDNILLLTDGLPTQGSSKPWKNRVSGEQRIKLFQQAIGYLPSGIPVNIILFPMEGDPMAASLYWKLALDTKGSFFTPSRDWP